jgi:hypothetical protein
MKSKNTKKNSEIKFGCDFCGRTFLKESTIEKHLCENKRRWSDKPLRGNRIGFQAWINFYAKNTPNKKTKTYLDFVKSSYYLAFVKFGHYCVNTRCINVNRYADWLLRNQIKIDKWTSDTNYTKFIVEYLREEDPMDAVARSIESAITLAEAESIKNMDTLRYASPNKICYEISAGRISPWLLYQSKSGVEFLGKIDTTQQSMILDYINPELWAIKFKRDPDSVKEVKELLTQAGF